MGYKIEIGRIHPAFFKHHSLFTRFDKEYNEKGGVVLKSPFFVLTYDFIGGELSCDDPEVLDDFVNLIQNNYGSSLTRDDVYKSLDLTDVYREWSVLNIGVCILKDNDSGWDGSPNCIFFDAEIPGVLVDIYFQYWNKKMLFDAWRLSEEDIMKLGGKVTLPNLVDSLILHVSDKKKHSKIEKLISSATWK